jgi:hypothetical protein
MCGKNIIPVESVMCKWRVFGLALLKGMEVKLHPLMAGAYEELEVDMCGGEQLGWQSEEGDRDLNRNETLH